MKRACCETNPGPKRSCCGGGDVGGVLTVDLSSLFFDCQDLDTTSDPQTVTITKEGEETVIITDVDITGDFAIAANTCTTLDPSESCTIDVTFTPTSSGMLEGTLTITSDAISGGIIAVDLIGISCGTGGGGGGGDCGLSVCPELDWGCVTVGEEGEAKVAKITNNTDETQTVYALATPGDPGFVISDAPATPFDIPAGESVDIEITFVPTDTVGYAGQLKVTSTAETSPDYVFLTGIGCGDGDGLLSMSVFQADSTSAAGCCCTVGVIRIFNAGGSSETINTLTTGANANFSLVYPFSATGIAPGETKAFPFYFCPGTGLASGTSLSNAAAGTTAGSLTKLLSSSFFCMSPNILSTGPTDFGAHKKSAPITQTVSVVLVDLGCPNTPANPSGTFFTPVGWSDFGVSGTFDVCNGEFVVTITLSFPYALDPGPANGTLTFDYSDCTGSPGGSVAIPLSGVILPEDPP